MSDPLLVVSDLGVAIDARGGAVSIVDDVTFHVDPGETLAVVGESGCGKSVTALSVLGLLDPPLRVTSGSIRFEGDDLLALPPERLRRVRGRRIAMIFQEPMTALNPVLTIGDQVGEGLRLHEGLGRREATARSIELLGEVGIPSPADCAAAYPHQLSGGMRQRAMIAMALSCGPALLIADEPTTALDVTIQAQILELLARLQRERGMSLLLITHDLGVVAEVARRVLVMYAGRVVEVSPVDALLDDPRHPYTRGLIRSVPSIDGDRRALVSIPGTVPSPDDRPPGCRFHPRCDERVDDCATRVPEFVGGEDGRGVACLVRQAEAST